MAILLRRAWLTDGHVSSPPQELSRLEACKAINGYISKSVFMIISQS
jgi:hypothetical protein